MCARGQADRLFGGGEEAVLRWSSRCLAFGNALVSLAVCVGRSRAARVLRTHLERLAVGAHKSRARCCAGIAERKREGADAADQGDTDNRGGDQHAVAAAARRLRLGGHRLRLCGNLVAIGVLVGRIFGVQRVIGVGLRIVVVEGQRLGIVASVGSRPRRLLNGGRARHRHGELRTEI
ncbi:MAG: hypothetical protein KF849_09100 [Rhizobiaceae bacterium]|nr:hypothetical protein [Rhizobiaceae bacterium]